MPHLNNSHDHDPIYSLRKKALSTHVQEVQYRTHHDVTHENQVLGYHNGLRIGKINDSMNKCEKIAVSAQIGLSAQLAYK